jgi:Immunity protein 21
MTELKWISSFGGPFILTSESSAEQWFGIDGSSAHAENDSSDYERACAAHGYVSKIDGSPHDVLVLNDGPEDITYASYSPSSGLIVKWMGADSDIQIINSLRDVNLASFTEIPLAYDVHETNLVAFDSSQTLTEIGANKLSISLNIGTYRFSYLKYAPCDSLSLLLIHMERA